MSNLQFDPRRYHRYGEITALCQAWAAAFLRLCTLQSLGATPQGRQIWCLTLTSAATGPDGEKPGYLLDGNVHAGEVTASAAALYTVHRLLTGYGEDAAVTQLLDTRAVYVIPRISTDGAEFYLTTPYLLRSAPRLYPYPEERPGLQPEDIDGDGRILGMRIADPEGEWLVAGADPRLMLPRPPDHRGGTYYRIWHEGFLKDWDGRGVRRAPPRWGLDFNRNYPAFWNPEGRQPGAGPFPLSEPEPRAVAGWLAAHPNIGAYVSLHTTGGILLRPPAMGSDEKIPAGDVELFMALGEVCRRLTGYPCKSTYEAFAYDVREPLVKGADDWAYEHLGVMAYTLELWDLDGRSGTRGYAHVGVKGLLALTPHEWAADELKRLQWNDRELGGRGFVNWYAFVHPQLGPVELGGWDPKFVRQNPPPGPMLLEECERTFAFVREHALATPRLELGRCQVEALAPQVWRLAIEVKNTGYLASSVTRMAVDVQQAQPVQVSLGLPEGARLLAGRGGEAQAGGAVRVLGHLEGRADAGSGIWGHGSAPAHHAWAEWVLAAPAGTEITVAASCPRAGVARATLTLT